MNLDRGREAQDLLMQIALEKDVDVVLISEQYRRPASGNWYQDRSDKTAIVIINRSLRITKVQEDAEKYTWVEIGDFRIYSCYYSPNDEYDTFLRDLDDLEHSLGIAKGQLLVAGDFNSKSPEWGSSKLDKRAVAIFELIARNGLIAQNEGQIFTFRRRDTGSVVNLTFTSIKTKLQGWMVLEDITLSDHQYIMYKIDFQGAKEVEGKEIGGWAVKKLDRERACDMLRSDRQTARTGTVRYFDAEKLTKATRTKLTEICDVAMPRRKKAQRRRKSVYWWTDEITAARRCLEARRRSTRNPQDAALSEEYKDTRKRLRTLIKSEKCKSWLELYGRGPLGAAI